MQPRYPPGTASYASARVQPISDVEYPSSQVLQQFEGGGIDPLQTGFTIRLAQLHEPSVELLEPGDERSLLRRREAGLRGQIHEHMDLRRLRARRVGFGEDGLDNVSEHLSQGG